MALLDGPPQGCHLVLVREVDRRVGLEQQPHHVDVKFTFARKMASASA
jgi:hypothetical protein